MLKETFGISVATGFTRNHQFLNVQLMLNYHFGRILKKKNPFNELFNWRIILPLCGRSGNFFLNEKTARGLNGEGQSDAVSPCTWWHLSRCHLVSWLARGRKQAKEKSSANTVQTPFSASSSCWWLAQLFCRMNPTNKSPLHGARKKRPTFLAHSS